MAILRKMDLVSSLFTSKYINSEFFIILLTELKRLFIIKVYRVVGGIDLRLAFTAHELI